MESGNIRRRSAGGIGANRVMPAFDLSGLAIEGAGGEAVNWDLSPSVGRMMAACDALPDGKAVTTRRLAELAGLAYNTTRINAAVPRLATYRIATGRGVLWANAATAARFRA